MSYSGGTPDPGETIKDLQRAIGKTEQDKGFRDDWFLAEKLEMYAVGLNREGSVPDKASQTMILAAAKALRANVIGMKMMLAVSEVAEALDSLRMTGVEDLHFGNIEEEYADAIIRLLANADLLGLDVGDAMMRKITKNKTRPHMHGKKL